MCALLAVDGTSLICNIDVRAFCMEASIENVNEIRKGLDLEGHHCDKQKHSSFILHISQSYLKMI